jgi:hypothetical protein
VEVYMSTNTTDERSREMRDPTNDEYLELEQRLGAAEYRLAADIAAENNALGGAMETAPGRARSAIGGIRRSLGKSRG